MEWCRLRKSTMNEDSMKPIVDLESRNRLLASWRGARVKVWLFHVTHMRLAICLSRPKEREAIYITAIGCRKITGPFSWKSADISISRQISEHHTLPQYLVADNNVGFELLCDSVTVVRGAAFVPTNPFRGFSSEDIPRHSNCR